MVSNAIASINLEKEIQIIRVLRTLSLIQNVKRLNIIFSTLASSLPGIGNTGALLFVIIYVYTVIGVQIFSSVARNSWGVSDWFNFESFPHGFLSLIAVGTGDSGPGLMLGSIRQYSIDFQCDPNPTLEKFIEAGGKISHYNNIK